jgi:hypothetical protein
MQNFDTKLYAFFVNTITLAVFLHHAYKAAGSATIERCEV